MHMDYEAELEFKHQKVADCIKRIGGIDVPVSPVIGADNLCRYRNKVQLPRMLLIYGTSLHPVQPQR